MKKLLKKIFITVISITVVATAFNYPQKVYANEIGGDPKIVSTVISGSEIITTYDNGIVVTEANDSSYFSVIVPAYVDAKGQAIVNSDGSAIQPRIAWVAIAKLIIDWVGRVMTVCTVTQWLEDNLKWKNPCKAATWATTGQGGNYLYKGRFIPGRVPNCEPIHSYQCNAGYYEYAFTKV